MVRISRILKFLSVILALVLVFAFSDRSLMMLGHLKEALVSIVSESGEPAHTRQLAEEKGLEARLQAGRGEKDGMEGQANKGEQEGNGRDAAGVGNPDESVGWQDRLFMTSEEVMAMQDLSVRDKLMGMSILKKVPMEDIERIYRMSEDGVTYGELEDIRLILEKYLAEEEVEKLDDLLMRHKKMYAGES